MTRAFDHHLAITLPRDLRQLTERLQLRKLRFIIGIGNRTGPQAITQRKRNVVSGHDLADLTKACVEKTLLVMGQTPLREDRATATHDSRRASSSQRNVSETHTCVNREVINALLGLFDECVAKDLPR